MLTVVDLFSGIGGFSLGLEKTGGFKTIAFCEIKLYPRRILRQHWPEVPIHRDIRSFHPPAADVICGGFPCQDISLAGKGAGLAGSRSGLWYEFKRCIEEVRPAWAIIENVAALRSRGLETVLRQLSEIGYDAEWHCIPASALGAPHRRDRLWIVAHSEFASDRSQVYGSEAVRPHAGRPASGVGGSSHGGGTGDVADANAERRDWSGSCRAGREKLADGDPSPDAYSKPTQRLAIAWNQYSHWLVEPDVGRVADGVPNRVDRLAALGNSIVPEIAEAIGQAILRAK